ncbi:hypothetical protein LUX39_38780 [Actinomadura madurae]|nr:hypothetical protein [Actinomadura madurae]MCQ0019001.1 hypothetical protein [Actinomadura madurae]
MRDRARPQHHRHGRDDLALAVDDPGRHRVGPLGQLTADDGGSGPAARRELGLPGSRVRGILAETSCTVQVGRA